MGLVQVVPKVGSYVDEWVALQYNAAEGYLPVKRLFANSSWVLRLVIDEGDPWLVATQVHHGSVENWEIHHSDWVIKSPHGKFWFMSNFEFESQFLWIPEK